MADGLTKYLPKLFNFGDMNARTTDRIMSRLKDLFPFLQVRCNMKSFRYRYLEKHIPPYILPDPLEFKDGSQVRTQEEWSKKRRPELLQLFKEHMYGYNPDLKGAPPFRVLSINNNALGGLAVRKEISVNLDLESRSPKMNLLIYLPKEAVEGDVRVPIFLGLNFYGNHTIHSDPDISLADSWIPINSVTRGRPSLMLRGIQSSHWPIEKILRHGYGVATVYCGEIAADHKDGLNYGIHKWFSKKENIHLASSTWGTIGCWAWGLSRAADYIVTDPAVDPNKIILIGHSRLGKAALWAGAQDQRFSVVISNQSGCAGASLSKRKFGESLSMINSNYPHWFCDNFKKYSDREAELPFDQHELISLIAPRPVYVASADLDLPADPYGEFLATIHARPVYRLFGMDNFYSDEFPTINSPLMGIIGYHLRKGPHGLSEYDWTQFIKFSDLFQRRRKDYPHDFVQD